MATSDDKHAALLSALGQQSGHVSDLELAWLQQQPGGADARSISDGWRQVTAEFLGDQATGSVTDDQFEMLGRLGHSGSASDRWASFWQAGGTISSQPTARRKS